MRVKHQIALQVGLDADFHAKLIYQEAEYQVEQIDDFQRATVGMHVLAAGGNESLGFGDVTLVRGLYLEADGDAQVDINGLGTITLSKAGVKAKLFLEAEITSLAVTNPSGDTALNLVYCVWGDPTV